MTEGFLSILTCIATLGLAILVGFVCSKSGYLPAAVKPALSKIVVKLTLPVLIAVSLTKTEITQEKLINSVFIVVCGLIVIGLLQLTGLLTERLFKKSAPPILHRCMTSFGNVVFVAYPLIQSLYGDEGLYYAALFAFSSDCWLWTFGVYSLSKLSGRSESLTANLKRLINPSTIAFAVSFIMMVFGLKFTGIIGDVMNGFGSMTTYLSMLFIGGVLADVDFRGIYKKASLIALTLLKMIIVPFILILIFKLIPAAQDVESIIILQAAMPVSTVLVMLCSEYGGDTKYSAEGVFLSTLASLVTLPLVYSLINII